MNELDQNYVGFEFLECPKCDNSKLYDVPTFQEHYAREHLDGFRKSTCNVCQMTFATGFHEVAHIKTSQACIQANSLKNGPEARSYKQVLPHKQSLETHSQLQTATTVALIRAVDRLSRRQLTEGVTNMVEKLKFFPDWYSVVEKSSLCGAVQNNDEAAPILGKMSSLESAQSTVSETERVPDGEREGETERMPDDERNGETERMPDDEMVRDNERAPDDESDSQLDEEQEHSNRQHAGLSFGEEATVSGLLRDLEDVGSVKAESASVHSRESIPPPLSPDQELDEAVSSDDSSVYSADSFLQRATRELEEANAVFDEMPNEDVGLENNVNSQSLEEAFSPSSPYEEQTPYYSDSEPDEIVIVTSGQYEPRSPDYRGPEPDPEKPDEPPVTSCQYEPRSPDYGGPEPDPEKPDEPENTELVGKPRKRKKSDGGKQKKKRRRSNERSPDLPISGRTSSLLAESGLPQTSFVSAIRDTLMGNRDQIDEPDVEILEPVKTRDKKKKKLKRSERRRREVSSDSNAPITSEITGRSSRTPQKRAQDDSPIDRRRSRSWARSPRCDRSPSPVCRARRSRSRSRSRRSVGSSRSRRRSRSRAQPSRSRFSRSRARSRTRCRSRSKSSRRRSRRSRSRFSRSSRTRCRSHSKSRRRSRLSRSRATLSRSRSPRRSVSRSSSRCRSRSRVRQRSRSPSFDDRRSRRSSSTEFGPSLPPPKENERSNSSIDTPSNSINTPSKSVVDVVPSTTPVTSYTPDKRLQFLNRIRRVQGAEPSVSGVTTVEERPAGSGIRVDIRSAYCSRWLVSKQRKGKKKDRNPIPTAGYVDEMCQEYGPAPTSDEESAMELDEVEEGHSVQLTPVNESLGNERNFECYCNTRNMEALISARYRTFIASRNIVALDDSDEELTVGAPPVLVDVTPHVKIFESESLIVSEPSLPTAVSVTPAVEKSSELATSVPAEPAATAMHQGCAGSDVGGAPVTVSSSVPSTAVDCETAPSSTVDAATSTAVATSTAGNPAVNTIVSSPVAVSSATSATISIDVPTSTAESPAVAASTVVSITESRTPITVLSTALDTAASTTVNPATTSTAGPPVTPTDTTPFAAGTVPTSTSSLNSPIPTVISGTPVNQLHGPTMGMGTPGVTRVPLLSPGPPSNQRRSPHNGIGGSFATSGSRVFAVQPSMGNLAPNLRVPELYNGNMTETMGYGHEQWEGRGHPNHQMRGSSNFPPGGSNFSTDHAFWRGMGHFNQYGMHGGFDPNLSWNLRGRGRPNPRRGGRPRGRGGARYNQNQ